MLEVIIIAGANGSGKTTFAKKYLEYYQITFVNADEIEGDIEKKTNKPILAGKIFLKQIRTLIEKKESFILESTLSGRYLLKTIEKLKSGNYHISIIYLFLEDPQILIKRIKVRVSQGGHFVPDADVIRRFFRSTKNFWKLYKNLVNEWSIFYNSNGDFEEIASGEKNDFTIINQNIFELFFSRNYEQK